MTLQTVPYPGKKEWLSIVNEMVDHARDGKQRARDWFRGETWAELKTVLFTEAQATYVEQQAFAKDLKIKHSVNTTLTPAQRKRKSDAQYQRWARYKQQQANIPTSEVNNAATTA